VYPIFVKFVRLTHSNKELLTNLLIYLNSYNTACKRFIAKFYYLHRGCYVFSRFVC